MNNTTKNTMNIKRKCDDILPVVVKYMRISKPPPPPPPVLSDIKKVCFEKIGKANKALAELDRKRPRPS